MEIIASIVLLGCTPAMQVYPPVPYARLENTASESDKLHASVVTSRIQVNHSIRTLPGSHPAKAATKPSVKLAKTHFPAQPHQTECAAPVHHSPTVNTCRGPMGALETPMNSPQTHPAARVKQGFRWILQQRHACSVRQEHGSYQWTSNYAHPGETRPAPLGSFLSRARGARTASVLRFQLLRLRMPG